MRIYHFKIRSLILLLVGLLLLNCSPAAAEQSWTLLMGVRKTQPIPRKLADPFALNPRRCIYHSYLIRPGSDFSVRRSNQLMVPRQGEFWRVGVATLVEGGWYEEQVHSTKIDQKTSFKFSVDPSNTSGHTYNTIVFVGENYLSVQKSTNGYTLRAAHPWERNFLQVRSLDKPGVPVKIQDVFGEEGWKKLNAASRKYLENHPDEQEKLSDSSSPTWWGLTRKDGLWKVRGLLSYSYEVYRGNFAIFDVDLDPVPKLVGNNNLAVSFEKIRERFPKVKDAFSSPDGKLTAVLNGSKFLLFESESGNLSERVLREIDLGEDPAVVMIHWLDESETEKWDKNLEMLFREKID